MAISNSIANTLSSKKFTYATKGIMGAVVGTTLLKAVGRPAVTLADKNSDPETKKYAATKEFLYQLLCLGMTFAMVIPIQKGCFHATKKFMQGCKELENIKKFKHFEIVAKDIDEYTPEAKKLLGTTNTGMKDPNTKKQFNLVKGAIELGSFVGSIVGLTIIAPWLSHGILHPIMKAIGMEGKDGKEHKQHQAAQTKVDTKA
jgi:hypothetical protein